MERGRSLAELSALVAYFNKIGMAGVVYVGKLVKSLYPERIDLLAAGIGGAYETLNQAMNGIEVSAQRIAGAARLINEESKGFEIFMKRGKEYFLSLLVPKRYVSGREKKVREGSLRALEEIDGIVKAKDILDTSRIEGKVEDILKKYRV